MKKDKQTGLTRTDVDNGYGLKIMDYGSSLGSFGRLFWKKNHLCTHPSIERGIVDGEALSASTASEWT